MDKLGNKIVYETLAILKAPFKKFKPQKDLTYQEIEKEQLPTEPQYLNEKQRKEAKVITQLEIEQMIAQGKKITTIDDYVYDLTKWIKIHPGGPEIIEEYNGRDSTEQFFAFHRPRVTKYLENFLIGKAEKKRELKLSSVMYRKLNQYLWKNKYFECDMLYYHQKYFLLLCFFITGVIFAYYQHYFISAILIAQLIKQSGFIAHDSLHFGIHPQKPGQKYNWHGMFFGSTMFGISSDMWNFEHTVHHAITRRPKEDLQFFYLPWFLLDAKEITWKKCSVNFFVKACVSVHNYTYIVLAVLVGRYAIFVNSILSIIKRKAFVDLIFMALFFAWWVPIIKLFDSNFDKFMFIFINNLTVGILHIQLLVNHMAVECFTPEEEAKMDFFEFQLRTSRNIVTYWYNTWFNGGLQDQIEHHLYPQLPRHNFTRIKPVIQEIAKKSNISYKQEPFFKTLAIIDKDMVHLADMLARGDII